MKSVRLDDLFVIRSYKNCYSLRNTCTMYGNPFIIYAMSIEVLLRKTQENYNHVMQVAGAKPKQRLINAAKLFLALTKDVDSKERNLISLSICCFSQALDEHYNKKSSSESLILGDYCYAQGIHIASLSGNSQAVSVLSRSIADITSGSKDGFSSMEEAAAYLAGYLQKKEALEGYRDLGKFVKSKDKEGIRNLLDRLGFDKSLVSVIAS